MRTNGIFVVLTILTGIIAGLGGMFLALLLHDIQHLAYGYSIDQIISPTSFLAGVTAAAPYRRLLILMLCGLVAGLGWWMLYRFGTPLMGITRSVKEAKPLPSSTLIHSLLQIITVALGSPLGREVAPREVGALFSGWLAWYAGLDEERRRILIACGAGAGLAAVYNVPFGGVLFILEGLLITYQWQALIPAITTCSIAVVVSWIGLGNVPQYNLSGLILNDNLVLWSVLTSPFFGFGGYWFNRIAHVARRRAQHHWQIVLFCFLNFTLIGLLAIYFPVLLGNGKSAVRVEFSAAASIGFSLVLLVLRVLTTWSSLRAGAEGGLLTPSLANGALLGGVLGGLWLYLFPGTSSSAFALLGASAFLAAAQRMPLTAIVLIFEFTRVDFSFIIPVLCAVGGAIMSCHLCLCYFEPQEQRMIAKKPSILL